MSTPVAVPLLVDFLPCGSSLVVEGLALSEQVLSYFGEGNIIGEGVDVVGLNLDRGIVMRIKGHAVSSVEGDIAMYCLMTLQRFTRSSSELPGLAQLCLRLRMAVILRLCLRTPVASARRGEDITPRSALYLACGLSTSEALVMLTLPRPWNRCCPC